MRRPRLDIHRLASWTVRLAVPATAAIAITGAIANAGGTVADAPDSRATPALAPRVEARSPVERSVTPPTAAGATARAAGGPATDAPGGPLSPGDEPGCGAATGDCFTPHAGAGCEWGPCCEVVCAIMPECCINGWDQLCVDLAEELCEQPPVCEVATGDCLMPGKRGGCEDRGCCAVVCAIDPFCCTSRWDSLCVAAAVETCGVGDCAFGVVAGSPRDENESCGEPINDGCDQPDGFAAGTLAVGETVLGRTYAVGRRDVDWYAVPRTGATLTIRPRFPAEVSIVVGDCATGFTAITSINVLACGEDSIDLPAGGPPAWVVIAPGRGGVPIVNGIACTNGTDPTVRTFNNLYTLEVMPTE